MKSESKWIHLKPQNFSLISFSSLTTASNTNTLTSHENTKAVINFIFLHDLTSIWSCSYVKTQTYEIRFKERGIKWEGITYISWHRGPAASNFTLFINQINLTIIWTLYRQLIDYEGGWKYVTQSEVDFMVLILQSWEA